MSTLYAHIGSEKCGSSLIEYTMLNARSITELLAKQDIVSARSFHIALRQVVVGTQWDESVHGRLRAQMLTPHRLSGKKVFVTEELLLSLMHEPGKKNPLDLRIDFAKRMFAGFDEINLILVVRRQDKFIESHYNQQVKRGETRSFDEILSDLPIDNYRWDEIADAWTEGFGEGSLTVIPFEVSVLTTAEEGPVNLVSAVLRAMDLNVNVNTDDLPIVNPSLRPELLAAQREINATFEPVVAQKIADILSSKALKTPGAAQGLFTPESRQALLDRFADSNKRLFEKYIPQCSVEEYLHLEENP